MNCFCGRLWQLKHYRVRCDICLTECGLTTPSIAEGVRFFLDGCAGLLVTLPPRVISRLAEHHILQAETCKNWSVLDS